MAVRFKPFTPFSSAMRLLIPSYDYVKGVKTKIYSKPEDSMLIYGSFRTFGGYDSVNNDLYVVVATATIDTWFNPDISANCRIFIEETKETWEIVGEPENINVRNQYMRIKVRKVDGGA